MPRYKTSKLVVCLGWCGKQFWSRDPTRNRFCYVCEQIRQRQDVRERPMVVRVKERPMPDD